MSKKYSIAANWKNIGKKAGAGAIINTLLRAKGLLFTFLVLIHFDKESVAQYGLALHLSNLVVPFILFNMPDSVNRFILGKNNTTSNPEKYISIVFIVFCLGILLTSLVYLIWINYQPNFLATILFLFILQRSIIKIATFEFQAFQNTKGLLINGLITEWVPLAIILTYIFYIGEISILYICIISFLVTVLWCFKTLYRLLNNSFKEGFSVSYFYNLLKTGMYLLPAAYAALVMQSSDILIVNYLLPKESVADYYIATSLGSVASIFSASLAVFWTSSAIYLDLVKVKRIVSNILWVTFLLAAVVWAVLFFSINLIQDIFLNDYNVAIMAATIGSSLTVMAGSQILSGILYSREKENLIFKNMIICAVLNVFLSYTFVNIWGINGAAYGTLGASLALFLLHKFRLKSILKQEMNH